MSVVERQALLANATPRPWEPLDVEAGDRRLVFPWIGTTNPDGDITSIVQTEDCSQHDHANVTLIAAAVNEYEALLACEAGLRALVGFLRPDNRHAIHARDALDRLDDIRNAKETHA